jgi:hypothetical protein
MGRADQKGPQSSQNGDGASDLRALISQLEAELRSATRRGASGASSLRLDARATAERTWRVTADRPYGGRGGLVGSAQRPVKAVVRKLARWYVEPVFADQRAFNAALLRLVDELYAENERLRAELDRRPAPTP